MPSRGFAILSGPSKAILVPEFDPSASVVSTPYLMSDILAPLAISPPVEFELQSRNSGELKACVTSLATYIVN